MQRRHDGRLPQRVVLLSVVRPCLCAWVSCAAERSQPRPSERSGLSYAQAPRFSIRGEALRRPGPSLILSSDGEGLLAKTFVVNETIGRGLSQDALSRVCASYLQDPSPERQAAGQAQLNGSLSPVRSCATGFLSRHQELRRYRGVTLEKDRARNSRPNAVAR